MARGLLPTPTASSHWLAHPEFNAAVADFLTREGVAMEGYLDELAEHSVQPKQPRRRPERPRASPHSRAVFALERRQG